MLRNIARFRLRAHTLIVETGCWQSTMGTVTDVTCMTSRMKLENAQENVWSAQAYKHGAQNEHEA